MRQHAILAGLAAAAAASLAFAQQPPAPNFAPPNTSAKGAQSMASGCAICHGTNGRAAAGSVAGGLAGRSKEDIVRSMAMFKSGQKPATVMHQISKGYSDAEVAAIAEYFAGQAR